MYSIRKHIVTFFLLLTIADILVILARYGGITGFDVVFFPPIITVFLHLYWGKSKLYSILKERRSEILKKYRFIGWFSTWEWNILRAASVENDELLKKIRNDVIAINLLSLLIIPNMIVMFNLVKLIN